MLITLHIVLVLPYLNMNLPQLYMCSPSCTRLPPPSPYHPSGSSQCTSPKHPVSCIKTGLAILFIYDIVHVSMPISQITPPSPTESLLFNVLSRVVITILPQSKLPLISWLHSPPAEVLEPRKINSATVSTVATSTSHDLCFLNVEV